MTFILLQVGVFWIGKLIFLIKFVEFYFQVFFMPLSLSPLFYDSHFHVVPQVSESLYIFLCFLFILQTRVSSDLSSSLLILSFAISYLLLILFSSFYFNHYFLILVFYFFKCIPLYCFCLVRLFSHISLHSLDIISFVPRTYLK